MLKSIDVKQLGVLSSKIIRPDHFEVMLSEGLCFRNSRSLQGIVPGVVLHF